MFEANGNCVNSQPMSSRPNVLPDERFIALLPALGERVRMAARAVSAENFSHALDASAQHTLLQGFDAVGAHEGTVWLADEAGANLIAAFNSGPRAAEIVGNF